MCHRGYSRLLVGALALALMASCAEERPAINRVQPNAIKKSFFVGENLLDPADDPEFWTQGTLVDVGYGAAQSGLFTSTYGQNVARVKFVIQEKHLLARLTYEYIQGSDGKGVGPASDDGLIVAAFAILSHFDIKRSYNPTTGEELNVIEENTSDRPWYEREYIRVDWSKNLQSDNYDFDTLALLGVYGGVKYEPLAYWVNDPESDEAPHFNVAEGYFDVTVKAFAKPLTIDISHFGWGIKELPACWGDADVLGGSGPASNCNPIELTIRHSFRRVDEQDYVPMNWDGLRFQAFGAFTSERKGYTRLYGMTDSQWYRFINRYNIWEQSHYYDKETGAPVECYTPDKTPIGADPNRDVWPTLAGNGTADECEEVTEKVGGLRGSQCDSFNQKCTLPYRARTAKPLAWYVTSGSNLEYWDGTDWATHEWDVAMRHAVLTAKYAECARNKEDDCDKKYPVIEGQADDQNDAVALAWEVDACRRGKAYPAPGPETAAEREARCQALAEEIGAKRGYKEPVIYLAQQPEMIVLCHSPVQKDDHPLCGTAEERLPEGITAAMCTEAYRSNKSELVKQCRKAKNVRLGDLRYHQVNLIQSPQTGSPWGIMVDSADPLTGMKIAASINVWTHVNDFWSQSVIDLSRYVKGELTTEEVTEGLYVKDWASAAQNAAFGTAPRMPASEVQKRIEDFAGVNLNRVALNPDGTPMDPGVAQAAHKTHTILQNAIWASPTANYQSKVLYHTRRNLAMGTPLEAELTTAMMQERVGNFAQLGSQTLLEFASPLRLGYPALQRELKQMRELALAARGVCVLEAEAPAPLSVAPLADVLERKFGAFNPADSKAEQARRAERMRRWVAQRAHFTTIAHEMGHSIGLRHNFVSSSDAWHYRPQYWQLRTVATAENRNGADVPLCEDLKTTVADQLACVGPRYLDPVTPLERDNLIWMFMQSSIMEYPGETTQDFLGLGVWDWGAARMFYGDAVAVYKDPSWKSHTRRGVGAIKRMDTFGGIVGFRYVFGTNPHNPRPVHYSALQREAELIRDCRQLQVDGQNINRASARAVFQPATWNEERDGLWDPLVDGLLISYDGGATYWKCSTQPVDYVQWSTLRRPDWWDIDFDRSGPSIDPEGRVRVPYGFGTDSWADTGNLSVYRHDNGADAYELFDFLISQQELNHIFDNYRRGRHTFTVSGAANRTLNRFNTKMRDGAKGLGLMVNIYKKAALETGRNAEDVWAYVTREYYPQNVLASTIAFDHFARQLSRPEAGPHYLRSHLGDPVLRSVEDVVFPPEQEDHAVEVPEGAYGTPFGNTLFGGRPVENRRARGDEGEYGHQITVNAGSYYDKVYVSMLLTESEDNFISDSRQDFIDPRHRAVSMADLFPDGFRRLLANNLTGDDELKGPRVVVNAAGKADPSLGIGWPSWTYRDGPRHCYWSAFNLAQLNSSNMYSCNGPPAGASTMAIDPQVGWEQWKFLIAFTLQHLPSNQQRWWLDMMQMWEVGADSDPGFTNRIEFHSPSGAIYVAKTFGKEEIFGKRVQKGIAARVLEYANELLVKAYEVDPGPKDLDNDGQADWFLPKLGANGLPIVKFDPKMYNVSSQPYSRPDCNEMTNEGCTCNDNLACMELERYVALPFFFRQAIAAYGMADPSMRGIFR